MKAKTLERQKSVQLHEVNDMDYIEIFANETEGYEKQYFHDVQDDGTYKDEADESHFYEYDYNEITVPHGTLDIEEIKKNPKAYLEYKPVAQPTIADLQEAINALQDIVLGE